MMATFLWNAIAYLPQCFSVLGYCLSKQPIIPIAAVGAAILVGGFTLFMKSMEKELSQPMGRKKKRKTKRKRP